MRASRRNRISAYIISVASLRHARHEPQDLRACIVRHGNAGFARAMPASSLSEFYPRSILRPWRLRHETPFADLSEHQLETARAMLCRWRSARRESSRKSELTQMIRKRLFVVAAMAVVTGLSCQTYAQTTAMPQWDSLSTFDATGALARSSLTGATARSRGSGRARSPLRRRIPRNRPSIRSRCARPRKFSIRRSHPRPAHPVRHAIACRAPCRAVAPGLVADRTGRVDVLLADTRARKFFRRNRLVRLERTTRSNTRAVE